MFAVLQPYPHATKPTSDDAAIELLPLLDDIIDSDEDGEEFNIFRLVKWKEVGIEKDVNALVEHILNEVQDFSIKPDKNIARNENMNHPKKKIKKIKAKRLDILSFLQNALPAITIALRCLMKKID